ncbi:glycosyltransferase family 4 protein [Tamlana sp. 2_MG-2023]|uniref:glycosyltransferase family 4 protein n=1 Tax=unclassified Tamlana TaxID=2614803 RepID=UPI0026E33120|nr:MULTISPECIES: glycosyltransferase family 4 protein [unclassified Tamlana]MDO6760249.1 glycosyltransferase family 4 protein [Tamlana sp. 2_MG-2023]MDO6790053.1 glycosyltransferase family 4 protein [Tamlana sp. 1_MG-2023]
MNLLLITTMAGNPWGGSEELWCKLAKEALTNNINVAISYFDWGKTPSKIKEIENLGVQSYKRKRIAYTPLIKKPLGKLNEKLWGIRDLEKAVLKSKPDHIIISMGGFCDLEVPLYQKFLKKLNIPFSLIVHSNPENRYFKLFSIQEMNSLCEKALKVFFVSNRLLEIAKRQTGNYFKNAEIILNPVNISNSDYVDYLGQQDVLNMACVGRISLSVKGQALLLQVLASTNWKKRNYILNIYGNGPDEDLLKLLVSKFKLENKVIFHGHVSDIRTDIWAKNQLLVMPSYYEGLPLALVEAMLCGRTAVCTDVGGAKEVLNENNGYFAEAATLTSFTNAMEKMWENKEQLQEQGKGARQEVLEYIGAFPKYNELLNNLLYE